jgi:hypothetical protein
MVLRGNEMSCIKRSGWHFLTCIAITLMIVGNAQPFALAEPMFRLTANKQVIGGPVFQASARTDMFAPPSRDEQLKLRYPLVYPLLFGHRKSIKPSNGIKCCLLSTAQPNESDCQRLKEEGIVLDNDGAAPCWKISHGNLIVYPNERMKISTAFGDVGFSRNSIALVMVTDDCLAVYSLHQSWFSGIKLANCPKRAVLFPGRELILASSDCDRFESLTEEVKQIPQRNPSLLCANADHQIFSSEFSIPATLLLCSTLRDFAHSTEHRYAKAYDAMVKDAAITYDMSASYGAYRMAERSIVQKVVTGAIMPQVAP